MLHSSAVADEVRCCCITAHCRAAASQQPSSALSPDRRPLRHTRLITVACAVARAQKQSWHDCAAVRAIDTLMLYCTLPRSAAEIRAVRRARKRRWVTTGDRPDTRRRFCARSQMRATPTRSRNCPAQLPQSVLLYDGLTAPRRQQRISQHHLQRGLRVYTHASSASPRPIARQCPRAPAVSCTCRLCTLAQV